MMHCNHFSALQWLILSLWASWNGCTSSSTITITFQCQDNLILRHGHFRFFWHSFKDLSLLLFTPLLSCSQYGRSFWDFLSLLFRPCCRMSLLAETQHFWCLILLWTIEKHLISSLETEKTIHRDMSWMKRSGRLCNSCMMYPRSVLCTYDIT